MTGSVKRVLDRLSEVGFRVQRGSAAPFGEPLPLVSGTAWDEKTAQLALIAESGDEIDAAQWKQLLFVGSGIRHQLAGDHASAFGTPIVLAVVSHDAATFLRGLAEDLAKNYAIFNRVDLNLIPKDDISNTEKLDDALAPLLPRCRSIVGQEISKREVQEFWRMLRREVVKAANTLDETFGTLRETVGKATADALIGDDEDSPQLPSPGPISSMSLKNFRSIRSLDLKLASVNIVHGSNGSGKTSLVEAMELGWSGTSERKPADVPMAEYARHLPTDGSGACSIVIDGRHVSDFRDSPQAELSRVVLTQEATTDLSGTSPKQRFGAMLAVTGLEIPDMRERTRKLVDAAKKDADAVLRQAGIAALPRADSAGLKHLRGHLRSNFLQRFSELPDLEPIEKVLISMSKGAYVGGKVPAVDHVTELLSVADAEVAATTESPGMGPDVGPALDAAKNGIEELLERRLAAAGAARELLGEINRFRQRAEASTSSQPPEEQQADAPIEVGLAVRWLSHSRGLAESAEGFREDANKLDDQFWAERMLDYAKALTTASAIAPKKELEEWSQPRHKPTQAPEPRQVKEAFYRAAGFARPPENPETIVAPLRELADALQVHVESLRSLSQDLGVHPSRTYATHADRVKDAICRFELARLLRREGPIHRASEQMVVSLLDDRLAPVVRELVAAIVRFEWYFKPLQVSSNNGELVLGGLATDNPNLDARMVLNSAEQSVLGVAWFLALHMLQPKERRRVLILDDPASGFDSVNRAGFASAFRAFSRLLEPMQIVVVTHDAAVAATLADEFALVGDWPASVARWRFQRDKDDYTSVYEEASPELSPDLKSESERLGLLE